MGQRDGEVSEWVTAGHEIFKLFLRFRKPAIATSAAAVARGSGQHRGMGVGTGRAVGPVYVYHLLRQLLNAVVAHVYLLPQTHGSSGHQIPDRAAG